MARAAKKPDTEQVDLSKATALLSVALEEASYNELVESGHRRHLGASVIGRECARHLWFIFRWAKAEDFPARMLRLFNRGHQEESRFIRWLKATGAEVWETDDEGNQFRITDVAGHFGGSCDGVARGIPGLPPTLPVLLEFKTHGEKSFAKLQQEGVTRAKPEHYGQMQVYMKKLKLTVGLYMAVNKNDDHLHVELIPFDKETADRLIKRARLVIQSEEKPPRISESPGFFKCTYCAHVGVCHLAETPEVNCRTCCYSTPGPNGTWICDKSRPEIEDQRGCAEHLFNPHLLDIDEILEGDTEQGWMRIKTRRGDVIKYGVGGVSSQDLKLK